MNHRISTDDRAFILQFALCKISPSEFHHREHLRLAYILLVTHGMGGAVFQMRELLFAFIRRNDVEPAKYHETLTQAWIRAVLHFMQNSPPQPNSLSFIDANPRLLDRRILLSHYSRELLDSDDARRRFVEPDLQPIPLQLAA